MSDKEMLKKITEILAIWVQEGYTDHEAMMMIYNLIAGGDR